jgi:hypothetical protein
MTSLFTTLQVCLQYDKSVYNITSLFTI